MKEQFDTILVPRDTPDVMLDNRHGRRAQAAMERKAQQEELRRLRRRLIALEARMQKEKAEILG